MSSKPKLVRRIKDDPRAGKPLQRAKRCVANNERAREVPYRPPRRSRGEPEASARRSRLAVADAAAAAAEQKPPPLAVVGGGGAAPTAWRPCETVTHTNTLFFSLSLFLSLLFFSI